MPLASDRTHTGTVVYQVWASIMPKGTESEGGYGHTGLEAARGAGWLMEFGTAPMSLRLA